jgi:FAD/FMN-containing dehydrogenase
MPDLTNLLADLADLDPITDPTQLSKLSQDYAHFSPILEPIVANKRADIALRPRTEADVIRIAAACYRHDIPLTIRGAGTGNYGQCVPFEGGLVLDMSAMTAIEIRHDAGPNPDDNNGIAIVEPGAKLAAIDRIAKPQGYELRMAPSTYRTATIGGFISGGSCGMGSINYGMLSDPGNVLGLRLITCEAQPRILELRGDDLAGAIHAYGTTGIITQLQLPLAPAIDWAELIISFDDFMDAARFGQAIADAPDITKKLITILAWPIPSYFLPLQSVLPPGKAAVLLMVADDQIAPLAPWIAQHNGQISQQKTAEEAAKGTPLLEYTWNHTTLHARSSDPSLTYLQSIFPPDPSLKLVETMHQTYGDEVMMHLEFLRRGTQTVPGALQIVKFRGVDRLTEIIQHHESQGAFIPNPHAYTVEDGGSKQIDPAKVALKREADPKGLLNPGKLRGWSRGVRE